MKVSGKGFRVLLDLNRNRSEKNIFKFKSLELFRTFRISGSCIDAVVAAAAAAPAPVAVVHATLSAKIGID